MTITASGLEKTFPRQFGSSMNAWLAIASRRGARSLLLAVVALIILLLAVLLLCLKSERVAVGAHPSAAPGPLLRPLDLPGSPEAETLIGRSVPPPLQGETAAVHNANTPFAELGPAARSFRFAGPLPDRMRARACLAAAMLFEAGDDGAGQYAVGQVVLNRVRHPTFPKSVCGVVLQGSERSTGCQFTFTCDGSLARRTTSDSRARALARADMMLNGVTFAGVGLATHYHTVDVYPWWSSKLEKIARQGSHLFLRWPGYWGSAAVQDDRGRSAEPSAALFSLFEPSLAPSDVADIPSGQLAALPTGAMRTPLRSQVLSDQRQSPLPTGGATTLIPSSRRLVTTAVDEGNPTSVVIANAALEGSRLLRMFSDEGVFYLQLAPGSNGAGQRRIAELLCGGRTRCQVYGWRDAAFAPTTTHLSPASKAALAFRFIKKETGAARPAPPPVNPI